MPRKCCVPGCKSNYTSSGKDYVNVFSFPKDDSLKSKWLHQIHRKDFVVNKESVVCVKHFHESFIIRDHKAQRPDGTELVMPRKIPILTKDAYPSIFMEQPKYMTSIPSSKRKDPNERQSSQDKRYEESFLQDLEKDVIKDFDCLANNFQSRISVDWISHRSEDSLFLMKFDPTIFPKFNVSIKICEDLSVIAWENGIIIPPSSLKWLFGINQRCLNWSTFDSLLSYLNSFKLSFEEKFNSIIFLLKDYISTCLDDPKREKLHFLCEQLQLCYGIPRYSPEFMIWASTFYYSYPSAYIFIRNSRKMTLPHINYLKRLLQGLGNFETGLPSTQIQYLKKKNEQLADNEKLVVLMIDEIYVKSELSYKGGRIVGRAENISENAKTLQAFMISSVFSKNKDVIALFPVKDQNSENLHRCLLCVLKALNETNYNVLCIISDNNAVNTKLYMTLGNGQLLIYISNPVNVSQKIFLLFDTVHLLKNIRNNWLNQKLTNQTFYIPPFKSLLVKNYSSDYLTASVSHLKNLYYKEKNDIVKLGPSLTRKALYPSNLERQNVRHALRLFDEKLIPALDLARGKFGDDIEGTAHFINIISKWWKVMNTQTPNKGRHLNDPYCMAISDATNDNSIKFLKDFCAWLEKWNSLNFEATAKHKRIYKLSNETFQALLHTTKALIDICKFLLQTLDPPAKYVLLGKFQTDPLEARFGQYRMMSGCNYTVSVIQILESERKLKLLSLLKLKSSKKGSFEIKEILKSCQQENANDAFWTFDSFFLVLENSVSVIVSDSNRKAIIFIAGYVARVAVNSCQLCKEKLTLTSSLECEFDEEFVSYLGILDRGRLLWPNDICVHICVVTFKLFQTLISTEFEEEFLNSQNQHKLLIELAMEQLQVQEEVDDDIKCINEKCKKDMNKLMYLCAKSMSNILINNYCKNLSDCSSSNVKKRKLDTLLL